MHLIFRRIEIIDDLHVSEKEKLHVQALSDALIGLGHSLGDFCVYGKMSDYKATGKKILPLDK